MPAHTKKPPIKKHAISKLNNGTVSNKLPSKRSAQTDQTGNLSRDESPNFIQLNLRNQEYSGELVEKTFIGPVEELDQLMRLANLLHFYDADETTSVDDLIDSLTPVDFLAAYRLREDLTQSELADKVHTTQEYIYDLETGKSAISVDMAKRLAKVLNCNYKHFL